MKRALLTGGGVLVVVVAVLAFRMLLGGRAELERAMTAADEPARVRHLGVAAIGITGGILVMVMLALTQYLGVR